MTYLIYPHAVSHSRSKRKNMSWLTATHLCDLWLTYRNKIHKYQNTFSPSLFVYLCHSHWINCIVIDIHTYTYGLSSGRGLKTKIRGTGKVMIKQLCLLSHVFFWDWGHKKKVVYCAFQKKQQQDHQSPEWNKGRKLLNIHGYRWSVSPSCEIPHGWTKKHHRAHTMSRRRGQKLPFPVIMKD